MGERKTPDFIILVIVKNRVLSKILVIVMWSASLKK